MAKKELVTDSIANNLLIDTRNMGQIEAIKYIYSQGYLKALNDFEDEES